MKTTITGATGFVGKNLYNYLKTFQEVSSISIRYIPNQQIKIETDVIIQVPLFINQDDIIKIDTRSKEYTSRVKI